MKFSKIVCLFFSLVLFGSCAMKSFEAKPNPQQEVGETQHEVAYEATYVKSVLYPKTNIAALDKEITDIVKDYESKFLNKIKGYKDERKAEFNIGYQSYLKDDRYISIKLDIFEHIYENTEYIETLVYDSVKEKFITLYDIMDEKNIQTLSNKVTTHFQERFPNECYNDSFRSKTSAVEQNFNSFVLRKDRIVFYFPQGSLFDNSASFESFYHNSEDILDSKKETTPTYVSYDQVLNEPVKNIDPNKPMIALTFDDGPTKRYTSAILDSLKEHNANATFFVLGSNAANAPELLQRMILEGHEIGNHTFSHKQLTTLSKANIEEEIIATQETIHNITNRYPAIIRPPYGSRNENVMQSAQGKKIVNWSIDTRDWKDRNADVIVKRVLDTVKDGDIILMHDLYASTAQAVSILVPQLQEQGYQLVTVSELYIYGKKPQPKIIDTK